LFEWSRGVRILNLRHDRSGDHRTLLIPAD
jgi:hypothetical protein